MPALLTELDLLLGRAEPGPETRGLLRLRTMARLCRDGDRLAVLFVGD